MELTEGARLSGKKGNEGVSKTVPANRLTQSAANINRGQTWLQETRSE